MGLRLETTTRDHRKLAAAVLEVLAGTRTPAQAAGDLSLSLPGYYKLEQRAIQGLIEACAPQPRGPHLSPQRELDKMHKQQEKLQRELHRQQALTRAAQRAVGLSLPPPPAKGAGKPKPGTAPGGAGASGGKRQRRPVTRALKAVAVLRQHPDQPQPAPLPGAGAAVAGVPGAGAVAATPAG
jgi:hypothetical protein